MPNGFPGNIFVIQITLIKYKLFSKTVLSICTQQLSLSLRSISYFTSENLKLVSTTETYFLKESDQITVYRHETTKSCNKSIYIAIKI